MNRARQRFAVAQLIRSSRATSRIDRPLALANTTRARLAKACAVADYDLPARLGQFLASFR